MLTSKSTFISIATLPHNRLRSLKMAGGRFLLLSLLFLLGPSAIGESKVAEKSYYIIVDGVVHRNGTVTSVEIEKHKTGVASPKIENGELRVKILDKNGKLMAENTVMMEKALVDVSGPTGDPSIDSGNGALLSTRFRLVFHVKEKTSSIKFFLLDKLIRTEKLQ